jgi:hypothetical protein
MLALYFDKLGEHSNSIKELKKVDPRRFDVNDGQWFNEKYEWLKVKYYDIWAEF